MKPGIVFNRTVLGRDSSKVDGGFILIGVLVIVLLASMVTMSLVFRVKAEQTATVASTSGDQAWAAAMSGVGEAMRVAQAGLQDTGLWMNNPAAFRNRLVFDDGSEKWYFSVFSESHDELDAQARFGLSDEASRISLQHADAAMLEKLPRMTPSLVQGILDFTDADNIPRPEGAEQEYYNALPRPYLIHNRPLNAIDELLLVRGITPELFYGEDSNWNCRLDPNEDDGEALPPVDNKDGRLEPGLRQYLTVSSVEPDNDDTDRPRTNINNPSSALPNVQLPESLTNYIAALRRDKVRLGHVTDLLEAVGTFKDESGKPVELASGIRKEDLALVLNYFSTTDSAMLRGLINVNTAPAPVLAALPGLDEALVDAILSTRKSLSPEKRRTIAWLHQEGVLDAAKFKEVAPRLTARSFQFSFRVVGYGIPTGRFRVLDVQVDLAVKPASVVRIRDISRFGLPFPIQVDPETAPAGASDKITRGPNIGVSKHG